MYTIFCTVLCTYASGRYQSRESISKKKKAPRRSMVSTTKSDRNHGKQFETEEGEAEGLPSRRINEDHHRELNKPY